MPSEFERDEVVETMKQYRPEGSDEAAARARDFIKRGEFDVAHGIIDAQKLAFLQGVCYRIEVWVSHETYKFMGVLIAESPLEFVTKAIEFDRFLDAVAWGVSEIAEDEQPAED